MTDATLSRPEVGDRVSLLYPGSWQRFGRVVATDYHPMGVEDAVKIRFEGEMARSYPVEEWWDTRYVVKVT